MKQSSRIVSDVMAAAGGQWPKLLTAMGINTPSHGKHGPCPACGGKDRFRLDDIDGRGTFICTHCGSGDGLDLVVRATGKTVKEAAELLAPLVGLPTGGFNPAELERIHQQQQVKAEQRRQQTEQRRQKAAKRATNIVRACGQGQALYLTNKSLCWPSGAISRNPALEGGENFPAGSLVVPLTNEMGELVNVQFIRDDGIKRYLAGGQKAGAFHYIKGGELVAVVEGYATGLSVHLATGATVYCAMDCGNLSAVAAIARSQCPEASIRLCGDNDEATKGNPGKTKAEEAATAIGGLVALPPIAGDWNDYHQSHGSPATMEAIMSARPAPTQSQIANQKKQGVSQADITPAYSSPSNWSTEWQVMPEGYEIRSGNLCASVNVGRGDDIRQEWVTISSQIDVLAETVDEKGLGYGRLLEWKDSAGQAKRWTMSAGSLVYRGGEEVFAALLDAGLPFIDLGHKRMLSTYLMKNLPAKRVTCVERTGWHSRAYVLPTGGIGPDAKQFILKTAGYSTCDFTERGTLAEWQQGVSALAVGNSRLCFALSLAFAAPLLSLVNMEGGGFHLKGESSDGKTTIMKVAASVYGNPDHYFHTWRATGNAIEGIASRHNDALLCLDELGELEGREAGQVAYMLANGQGKGRSKQDGELRERKAWRLLFLSTGELSLEDHIASAGQRIQAGMEVRIIQIPSDTGQHGAFERLHGLCDGRNLADTLKIRTSSQHGTAFRAFIEALAADPAQYKARLIAEIKQHTDEQTPNGAGSQVVRAISRFALVAAAGELATSLGMTGWPAGEAVRAMCACLKAWLAERGHLGNKEDTATLQQVRGFVAAHQYTRFADWFDPNHRPANMVGYRKVEADGVSFFILPLGWAEITKGRDPKRAVQLCLEAGYLLASKDKQRLQRKVRLPSMTKPVWVYLLTERVLADEAGSPDDES